MPRGERALNPVGAFFVKLFMQAMIFMLLLPALFSISLGSAAIFALVMSLISFVIGDIAVLRPLGRVPAAIVDFGLVAVALELYPGAYPHLASRILLTAAVITVGEVLLHSYLPHRGATRI